MCLIELFLSFYEGVWDFFDRSEPMNETGVKKS